MLDVEYVEELLTILLKGIQDKKDYLDAVCEEYMQLDNRADIVETFNGVINDISRIFDEKGFPIKNTRFKQKSDFYSLFACIFELRKEAVLKFESLESTREILREMCDNIGPQSEDDLYREYATRCLSDANSLSNRQWRVDFLMERLSSAYRKKAEYDDNI